MSTKDTSKNQSEDPQFYEDLDEFKAHGEGLARSLWSFVIVWGIIFVVGTILIFIYGSSN